MSPSMQRLRAEIASDLQIFASRVEVLTSLPPVLSLLSEDLKRFDEFLPDVGRE